MSEQVTPPEEEIIDMVEEPGSNTWTSSGVKPGSGDVGQTVPLFGSIPGLSGGKGKLPLIIGLIVLALLACCALNSCKGCSNLLGGLGGTTNTGGGLLGGLLGGNTNQAANTEYQAQLGQEVTIGGVTSSSNRAPSTTSTSDRTCRRFARPSGIKPT